MASSPEHDLQEARESMALSQVAYAGEGDLDRHTLMEAVETGLAEAASLAGNFGLLWLGISPDSGTLMFVARDARAPGRLAIVVRGSDFAFPTDWRDDLDVLTTHDWPTAQPPDPDIAVASGSWDGLQDLLAMTAPALAPTSSPVAAPVPLISLIMSEALAVPEDLDLVVTGHSLGGALASLLALWLGETCSTWRLRPGKINLTTYTFASPTVGNQPFADYYNAQSGNERIGWRACRVYNEQDVVPSFFGNPLQVADNGIPVSDELRVEIAAAMAALEATLAYCGVGYVQVGRAEEGTAWPLPNDPPAHPPTCADPATTLVEYAGCWVGYEHATSTYLHLLGVEAAAVSPPLLSRAASIVLLAAANRARVGPGTAPTV